MVYGRSPRIRCMETQGLESFLVRRASRIASKFFNMQWGRSLLFINLMGCASFVDGGGRDKRQSYRVGRECIQQITRVHAL